MPIKDIDLRREYHRHWIKKRRDEFFADKSCVQCGSLDRLELDHIDPAQKVDHKIWLWAKERREAEIVKCQVLCFDCHCKKTSAENTWVSDTVLLEAVRQAPTIRQALRNLGYASHNYGRVRRLVGLSFSGKTTGSDPVNGSPHRFSRDAHRWGHCWVLSGPLCRHSV
jgi:hypothetical protein